jgi:all-trans-8'-apo-beta-carotenal 15,15'-oxygenase
MVQPPVVKQGASTAEVSYSFADWQRGYESLKEEHAYWIEEIEGAIPLDLQGTLFRNGPGLLDVNGQSIRHPFDGDGMVCAIALKDGRAYFQNRYVHTEGYLAEQEAGRILYRGVFGTQKPGGWLANAFDFKLKNIANTHVIYWGHKLLALWEAAEPHRLDPRTLETLGIERFDGQLAPGDAFAAHPRIDPACSVDGGAPRLVNFAIQPGFSTSITIFELNQTGKIVERHIYSIPGFAFIHDFALTLNYYIFLQNPIAFNPLPFVLGQRGAGECLSVKRNQPTRILVIPRHGRGKLRTFTTEAGFVFHHANAFEQEGRLYLDSICYAEFPQPQPNEDFREVKFARLPPGQLWRFSLDLQAQTVKRQLVHPRGCEFPTVNPARVGRPYRYLYLGATDVPEGNAPLQAILKLDLETGDRQVWSAAPRGFVGEPVFVPRSPQGSQSAEDEGWLLTLCFDAAQNRSELVILDAQDLNRGAIARLRLKHHVPYGLHGMFTPEYFGPDQ